MLAGKKILIAISGSIAAYKIAFFVRLLIKKGAEVQVIMTHDARNFIPPLTLATLSKKPVYSSFYKEENGEWNNHVELGMWADLMVIAPLSANTLAKISTGLCDNLVVATYLSARCPVILSPAMDLDMYQHPTTQSNLSKTKSYGNTVVEARSGELASGLEGVGRMAEPEELLEAVEEHFSTRKMLAGKKILLTSGPTHEKIDAVRFIGNHSSGKMGYSLAMQAARLGADVTFVTGPVSSLPEHENISIYKVESANEMLKVSESVFPAVDIAVFAAAVSDFRPAAAEERKRKRSEGSFQIDLVENPDIAKTLSTTKKNNQITVGFALETDHEEEYAKKKLKEKNFDFIVLNSMKDQGAGFAHQTNKITIYDAGNNKHPFELKSKDEVAIDILDFLIKKLDG